MSKEKRAKKKEKKGLKIFLRILAVLLVIILAIGLAGYLYINGKFNQMQKETIDKSDLGISNEAQQELKNYRNIALLGIDSRADDYGLGNRSDCIIIASINTTNSDVKLFSVYRDTYVDVEEKGTTRLDKITHAYSYGGAQNALKSLNKALDLNIDEYVTVNFDAVIAAVDELGGVQIDIDSSELKYINSYIDGNNKANGTKSEHITKSGVQKLDGNQALAYGRIRYTEGGDFKRTERMRTVLQKVFTKLKSKSITELYGILDEILPKVQTNITKSEIIALAPKLVDADISDTFGFPYNAVSMQLDLKDYYEGTTKGKDYYDIPTKLTEDVEKLHKDVLKEENYTATDTIKEIYSKIKEVAKI